MSDVIFKRRDATRERITWQLESERKGIFTLNEEDLFSYKTQFMSECKYPSVNTDDPAIGIMGTVRGYFHGGWFHHRLGVLVKSHRSFSQTLP